MGYKEPFGGHACIFVCLFYVLFSAVLNMLIELIPYSTNRLTSDQRERNLTERKTELSDQSTFRSTGPPRMFICPF